MENDKNQNCTHPGSSVSMQYADGGREYQCAGYEWSPDSACGLQYYRCRHGVEFPANDTEQLGVCEKCDRDIFNGGSYE